MEIWMDTITISTIRTINAAIIKASIPPVGSIPASDRAIVTHIIIPNGISIVRR